MENIIEKLNLKELEHESGLFRLECISRLQVEARDGPSPASNCIYYALTREFPQNHLHWLIPDDYHILIEGGPADYYLFYPDGRAEKKTLGREIESGQMPIVLAEAGCGKAVRLQEGAEYILVGSVNTPAWTPERVSFGGGKEFIERYTHQADWATPEFLRELIGPNWKES
ncbi:MAG: cupin domain-containing protein [Verrucomicrobiae bacterium]|nr:cupin domain-containing protein [Verrucomicrobiae bacterium]